MAIFPKVQSPCPYKSQLAEVMDGDMCRMCNRQVFDLTAMSDGERVAFMRGCAEEVCVSYRFPVRVAAAAAIAVAALAAPMAAAAQDATDVEMVIVGGIRSPDKVEYITDAADSAVPELRVVYEDQPVAPAAATTPVTTADAAKPAPVRSQTGS